ncbi:MAG: hypothetical protein IPI46_06010 [Bacteroidetes bacterium]|nr:hypothetical protein [Bacteroidota bacterium]
MKKSNKTAVAALTIISSVAIGVTLGWFLFPRNRKKCMGNLKSGLGTLSDTLKIRSHGFIDGVKIEVDHAYDKINNYMQMEKVLNAKILKITMKIRNEFPELYSYIEEMPVSISHAKNPEINVINLKKYYNSLEAILKNYTHTHTKNEDKI